MAEASRSGSIKRDTVIRPKSVILSGRTLNLGLGFPIRSNEFFIASEVGEDALTSSVAAMVGLLFIVGSNSDKS